MSELSGTIKQLIAQGATGANITSPCKHQAWMLADIKDFSTQIAQSANTLHFHNGKIIAYNTDGPGLLNDLKKKNISLSKKNILIIGAGSTVSGILLGIINSAPYSVTLCNRSLARAENVVRQINSPVCVLTAHLNDIPNIPYDIVFHVTSVRSESTWNTHIKKHLSLLTKINASTVFYDLNYQATPTPFLRWAKNKGAKIYLDGRGMLIEQAALSFEIWYGLLPSTERIQINLY